MNKTLKLVLKIMIIAIAVLTVALLGFAFFTKKNSVNNTNNQNAVTNINSAAPQNTNTAAANLNDNNSNSATVNEARPSDLETSLKSTAMNFAERFGSYSNQSNYENLTKLALYMSERMQNWADDYIAENQTNANSNAPYKGYTAKALNAATVAFDENKGTAEFLVGTQRKEFSSTVENSKVYNQNITIKFVKEKDAWKVNEAFWQAAL